MGLIQIFGGFLVLLGLIGMIIGSIGLVRLPDFFTRTHAASKVDTVGVLLTLVGIAVLSGFTANAGKALVAGLLLMLTNPVAAHALARAARRRGMKPWTREVPSATRGEKD